MDEIETSEGKIFNRREVALPLGYIEIFSRTGKLKYRVPVRQLGLCLGRAYDNDIILDDPYVCPHHASFLWENGRLIAEDLNSVNGLIPEGKKHKEDRVHLSSGDRLRVGRTMLRFCGADLPVPRAQVELSARSPVRLFEHPLSLVSIYLVMLAYAAFSFHLDATARFDGLKFAVGIIGVLAMVVIWSAIWAFVSRIIIHRWNFFIHCGIASLALIAFSIFEMASSYLCFAFGIDIFLPSLGIVGFPLLTALLIYFQLRYVSLATPSQVAKASLGIAIVIVGLLAVMTHLEQNEFSYSPRFNATLKPPVFKLVDSEKTASFFASSPEFRKKVDDSTLKR